MIENEFRELETERSERSLSENQHVADWITQTPKFNRFRVPGTRA